MRRNMFSRAGATFIAVASLTLGLAIPGAAANDGSPSVEDLPGAWVGTGSGFVGATAVTNQLWIRITKTNGLVGTGTQRWRSCKGRQQACQQGSTRGGGWSKREPVSIAVLTNGTIAGADLYGVLTGSVYDDGSMEIVYSEKVRISAQETPVLIPYRLVRSP